MSNASVMVAAVALLLTIVGMGQPAPKAETSTYSIAGCVIDAKDGQPVSNAEVYLGRNPENTVLEALLASPTGRFSFTGLPAGKYILMAGKKGFVTQRYGEREGYVIGIAVGPGVETPDVLLQLQVEGAISGTVEADDGAPIRGAEVSLFRRSLIDGQWYTLRAGNTSSDELGHYRLGHLSPGTYYLAAQAEPEFSHYFQLAFSERGRPDLSGSEDIGNLAPQPVVLPSELDVAYPLTFFPTALSATEAQSLVLHPGEKLPADFHLRAVPAIHVKVPSGGQPTFRAHAFDEELEVGPLPIPSDLPGWQSFIFAPGKYSVAMNSCDENGCLNGASELQLSGNITFDPKQIAENGIKISGTAVVNGGAPLSSGAIVTLIPRHSTGWANRIMIPVDEHGKFEWSGAMRPAKYTVLLENTGLSIQSMAVDGASMRGTTLSVHEGGSLRFGLVLTSGHGQVQGTVLNGGKPVAGAMVLLVAEDFANNPQLFRRDESDSDGTFTLPPVPPGRYIAVALEHGWEIEWAKPDILKPYLAKGQLVKIASGANLKVTLDLQK